MENIFEAQLRRTDKLEENTNLCATEEPEQVKEFIHIQICPTHKKGEKLKCENHRGISLLCVVYKVFTEILRRRTYRGISDRL